MIQTPYHGLTSVVRGKQLVLPIRCSAGPFLGLINVGSGLILLRSLQEPIRQHHELQEMLESDEVSHRQSLAEEFLLFSESKQLYDQIRFLDETGMEVVRVNFNNGKPYIVPEEQLQSKADRYYFKETFRLGREEVYVSPFDLNIKRGQIEQPLKPMIRFGTPVFDSQGRKRGIVVLNYLGVKLIQNLHRMHENALMQGMLLNSDGFWLHHSVRPEVEWGFIYDGGDRTFGNAFPEAWRRISSAESGQFYHAGGMFTFATVYPLLEVQKSSTGLAKALELSAGEGKTYYWKLVSYAPPEVLNAGARDFLGRLLLISPLLVVVMAVGSWFLAREWVSRQRAEVEVGRLASFPEQNPDPVIETDLAGRVTYLNPAAESQLPDLRALGLQHRMLDGLQSIIAAHESGRKESFVREIGIDNSVYEQKISYVPGSNIVRIFARDITERKQAMKEIQLHRQREAILHDINLTTTSILDLRSVLDLLTEKINLLLPYAAIEIWLVKRESGVLEYADCRNLGEEEWVGREFGTAPALPKAVMENKVPVLVSNIHADAKARDAGFFCKHGFVSYLGVPLVAKGEVLGVLSFLTLIFSLSISLGWTQEVWNGFL